MRCFRVAIVFYIGIFVLSSAQLNCMEVVDGPKDLSASFGLWLARNSTIKSFFRDNGIDPNKIVSTETASSAVNAIVYFAAGAIAWEITTFGTKRLILWINSKDRKKRDLQTLINADTCLLNQSNSLFESEKNKVYRRLAKNSEKFSALIG